MRPRTPFSLSKNPPQRKPRRVPSSAVDGIKLEFIISGDMRPGNDTSHGVWGGFFSRNRVPSVMPPSAKEALRGLFGKFEECGPHGPALLF